VCVVVLDVFNVWPLSVVVVVVVLFVWDRLLLFVWPLSVVVVVVVPLSVVVVVVVMCM